MNVSVAPNQMVVTTFSMVGKDMTQAQSAGATGTPSFVLAETDPSDPTKVKGISFIRGAQAFNAFKAAIDSALEEAD